MNILAEKKYKIRRESLPPHHVRPVIYTFATYIASYFENYPSLMYFDMDRF